MNSKQKGKRGELAFVHFCKEHGYEARRTAQYCGNTGDAADVVGLPYIHVEVKNVERLNIWEAMAQAIHDSMGEKIPIVAHTKNHKGWLITMQADDWFKLYDAWGEQYEKAHKAQAFTTGDGTESGGTGN